MTIARKYQISVSDTPYYHLVSRCVRKSFLCGIDIDTGRNYEHRRQWIENRIRLLSSIFPVDICSYAVMSNHIHIVARLCPDEVDSWTAHDVLDRWTCLYKGPLLVQQCMKGDALDKAQRDAVDNCVAVYRKRFKELGWFMKALNEPIARQANKEDGCTGHFWESRYKSQALLTEEALLTCMAYVDLNPIRANMADTPENSDHTSVKERITPHFNLRETIQEQIQLDSLLKFDLPLKPLLPFAGNETDKGQHGILFSIEDYLELVDASGRIIKQGKRGAIKAGLPSILQRLNLDIDTWISRTTAFEKNYTRLYAKRKKRYANAA